jgi:hypothetical protein
VSDFQLGEEYSAGSLSLSLILTLPHHNSFLRVSIQPASTTL